MTTDKNVMSNGVLKLANITNRRISSGSSLLDGDMDSNPAASVQSMIATSKMHASREIKEFNRITDDYIKFLESSALFSGLGEIVEALLREQMLHLIIEPTLAGNRIMGMPQDKFNALRRDMFKSLIDKYNVSIPKQGGK